MQDAGIIISINNDENAPINTIADYVINGTVEEVIPKMIKYYKRTVSKIMANFYTDNPSLKHHLHHPLMKRIVELKERAMPTRIHTIMLRSISRTQWIATRKYWRSLVRICGEIIAPNAEGVDHEGPTVANGRVTYASGHSKTSMPFARPA